MNNENKDNSSLTEHGRMIQQTILNLYKKFKSYLLLTSTYTERKYFPTREAKQFSYKIKEINDIFQSLSDSKGCEHMKKLTECVKALEIAAKYMHNQDGISAFSFLLDMFIDMTSESINSHKQMIKLMNENQRLILKVKELESVLSDMENDVSLEEMSISDDGNVSDSLFKKQILQYMSDAILFCSQNSVSICETFVSVDKNDGQSKLIVLYEDLQNEQPPSNSYVIWRNVNSVDVNLYYDDFDIWENFCQHDEFMQLLEDFYDPSCINLIQSYHDIVAIYPTAWSINGDCPFEPALVVCRKFADCDDGNLGEYLTLSDGRSIKVIIKENYFSEAMYQPGIGVVGFDNKYGSIGGIACDDQDQSYLITCEHVVVAAQDLVQKQGKLAGKKTKFMIPSPGTKKASIVAQTGGFDTDSSLNLLFVNTLMTQYEKPSFTEIFRDHNQSVDSSDITLKEVSEYVTKNHYELDVPRDTIITFSKPIVKEINTAKGVINITYSGDVAAIPTGTGNITFNEARDVNGIFGLDDLFIHWQNRNSFIDVFKKGVNDSSSRSGRILKPVHIRTPADSKSKFMTDDYASSTLDTVKGSHGRTLLGQLLVHCNDFGCHGDSGSSVYVEDGDSNSFIIGTFVGGFKNRVEYVVSPAEVIVHGGLQWTHML